MGANPASARHPVPHYWSSPTSDLLQRLQTTSKGLTSQEGEQRLLQYGANALKPREKLGALALFLGQFRSPIVLILLFATVISAVLRDWVDAVIILAIVVGSAVLSFVQEHSASNAVEKLRAQVTIRAAAMIPLCNRNFFMGLFMLISF